MAKLIFSSLIMLLASTTSAASQNSSTIFLDCDVDVILREPAKNDGKTDSGKMYYKIDIHQSLVSKFDTEIGKYEILCSDRNKPRKLGVSQGSCNITEDFVYASGTSLFLGFTVWQTVSLYRYSGRVSTSTKIYSGKATEFEDLLKMENITHRIDTQGNCKQGNDMSLMKKAF